MSFRIIAGAANTGKSQRLCAELVKAAAAYPNENFIALVPEQFTLQMQRRVVEISPRHAVMNIDIVSFNRLALKVFDELGINLNEVLDDTGKALVLRKVLSDNAADLCLYGKNIHMEGFIDEMKSVITELKTYAVTDEQLKKAQEEAALKKPELEKKLRDIRLIYAAFNNEIKNIYTTSEEVPDLFARVLRRCGYLRGAHILLDGFTGFTPVQYKIIEGFLDICADVCCAVTAPQGALSNTCRESSIFYLPNRTYNTLTDLASKMNIETDTLTFEPLSDEHADAALVNGSKGNRAQIFEYEGKNAQEEAFFAAGEITRLVREEKFRFREIALVCADMETYAPYLEKAFAGAHIPAFIDRKSSITDNRLSKFVLGALRVVKEKFSYESVFSYLKCYLTDLTFDETARLENYCLEFGIKGPVVWNRDFTKNRTLSDSQKAWDLEEVNALRLKVMASLGGFASSARRAKCAADFYAAFEKLFEANRTKERLEEISKELESAGKERAGEEYSQIFETIHSLLEKACVLTKNLPVSLDDYINIIRNGIREIKMGLIPPTLDMVTAGDLERSRLNKIKALFVLGVNEGVLLKTGSASGILNSDDRRILKDAQLELAPGVLENYNAQRYYIYLMLNKPKNFLYLCSSSMSPSAQALKRSEVFDEIDEYVEGGSARLKKTVPAAGNVCADEKKSLCLLASQLGEYARSADDGVIDASLLKYFYETDESAVKSIVSAAFYTNTESPLNAQTAAALYGERLSGSVSRFENFNGCAFRHFLGYALGLEKRAEYEIRPDFLGTICHSALEKYVNGVREQGRSLRDIDDEKSRKIAAEAARSAISEDERHIFESSARSRYQAQRITEIVVKTTDIMREKIREGKFDAAFAEERFSSSLEDGSVFTGKIDRIDIYENNDDIYVNIVDYKTGAKKFDLNEMLQGLQLQLPAYLRKAVELLQKRYPGKHIHPAGIYYFLVRDEFETAAAKDRQDAHLNGLSDDEKRMDCLMGTARDILEKTCARIKAGEVSPSPVMHSGEAKMCGYCDFREICRFKAKSFGAKGREAVNLSKEDLEKKIYG